MEERLRRLEREARAWRVLAVLLCAGMMMGAGQDEQVRCSSLVVESSPGSKDGVLITSDPQRGPTIYVSDPEGKVRLNLGTITTQKNRYGIQVSGRNAETWITAGENETVLQIMSGGNYETKSVIASTDRGTGLSVTRSGQSKAFGLTD